MIFGYIKAMKNLFLFAFLVIFSVWSTDALAKTTGRGFTDVEYRTLTQTYFAMYDGGNPTNQMLDEYAQMTHCDLYKEHFTNDFKWEKIRGSIRKDFSADNDIQVDYEIKGDALLGRYDFEKNQFPVIGKARHDNIGKLFLFAQGGYFSFCNRRGNLEYLPASYVVKLFEPFSTHALDVPPEMASAIVNRMYMDKKTSHKKVFARYRVTLYDISDAYYDHGQTTEFQGELISIDYFLDPEMTQKFHTIQFQGHSAE